MPQKERALCLMKLHKYFERYRLCYYQSNWLCATLDAIWVVCDVGFELSWLLLKDFDIAKG